MPPVVRERAGHGHIGISDGLYLLQSVPRTDVVERRKIPIKEANERRRLRALGQQRKTLEIGEQDRRRADVSGLDLAVLLQFLGDCSGQQIPEQLFGARLLGSGSGSGVIQFPDRLVVFNQLATQFQLRQHLMRQPAQ